MVSKILAAFMTVTVLAAVLAADARCYSGADVAGRVPQVLSAGSKDNAKYRECTLGDAVADAIRTSLGVDIAIVCGGDLFRNLPSGEITWDGLKSTFVEDRTLATVDVTPKELCSILESGLSHITLDKTDTIDIASSAYDGFPQISGFSITYDSSGPIGKRVYELRINGTEIDRGDDTTILKLAATEFMLSGGYGLPVVKDAVVSEFTLSTAFAQYMNKGMAEYDQTGLRIYPLGAQNGSLIAMYPLGIVAVAILMILIGNGSRFKHMFDFRR